MNSKKSTSLSVVVGVLLAVTLPLAGCATTRVKGIVVTNCVSDPLTQSLHCVDRFGLDNEVLYKDSSNYVCRPPEDDKILQQEANQ